MLQERVVACCHPVGGPIAPDDGLRQGASGKTRCMSLAATIIVCVVLAIVLIGTLAFVMSRPKELRPHRPSWRRVLAWRRRRPPVAR
jgi:hypothetical protein